MTICLPDLFPRACSRHCNVSGVRQFTLHLGNGSACWLVGWLIASLRDIGTAAATMLLIYLVGLIVTPFAGPEPKERRLPMCVPGQPIPFATPS